MGRVGLHAYVSGGPMEMLGADRVPGRVGCRVEVAAAVEEGGRSPCSCRLANPTADFEGFLLMGLLLECCIEFLL